MLSKEVDLKRLQTELRMAKAEIAEREMLAPLTGVVVLRFHEPGEAVGCVEGEVEQPVGTGDDFAHAAQFFEKHFLMRDAVADGFEVNLWAENPSLQGQAFNFGLGLRPTMIELTNQVLAYSGTQWIATTISSISSGSWMLPIS
mgnify:CR=1 FL=1